MFSRRRARKAQEQQRDLSARIRSAEAADRAGAAAEIAKVRDQAWALRELAQALEREPLPDTFSDIAGAFCDALFRDRVARERVEQILALPDDQPAELVRAWTAFMAECGAGAAMETVDDELGQDVRSRLRRLAGQGWRHRELSRMHKDSFAYYIAFGTAVVLVHDAVRRSAPLPGDEAEHARKEIRTALERALALPADSDERLGVLVALSMRPDEEETWTDRALAGLRIDEALALCRSPEPARVTLGLEALHSLMLFGPVLRRTAIRTTLDRVCVPDQEPYTFSEGLLGYAALQADDPLDDPPVELFLNALGHPDEVVRAAAASGLDRVGPGLPEEQRVVAALTDSLDSDPDAEVVRCAATALAGISCADEANTRAASRALARHADSADARVRAASVEGALLRDEPGAFARLTTELQRADVQAVFVSVTDAFVIDSRNDLTDVQRAELTRHLERLRQDGWAEHPGDDDETDAETRAGLVEQVLVALRGSAR
ncbi:HEAT repeat domain-containing protein [Streptomyces sp. NPDC047043]|uniref:HEAT repeat domain-containing protein n=1 Tax=Streptomyces sp. NPDC047043 TaxID=3154497 RepID=UPI0033F40688